MANVTSNVESIGELLNGKKYSIDYYQREYCWEEKQIEDLISDLYDKFIDQYADGHQRKDVGEYANYFLGSIIVSQKKNSESLIDGQQRLTSLTLLLIFIRHLQKDFREKNQVNVDNLIRSRKFGTDSFNIDVEGRVACMQALFDEGEYEEHDEGKQGEDDDTRSVKNICRQYEKIGEHFPDDITEEILPYFTDWLLENVKMAKIVTDSDDEAYTIFETMNDRGLSLTPTDKLKGYLLANIDDERRGVANEIWLEIVEKMVGIKVDSEFFKAWLRSQHAESIRATKKDAKPEDFDKIGTDFYRWLKESRSAVGLQTKDDFYSFMGKNLKFYAKQFLLCNEASSNFSSAQKYELEHVFYNSQNNFPIQHTLLLAPLKPEDAIEVQKLKMQLVAQYIDIFCTRRIWNSKAIDHKALRHFIFSTMKEIRHMDHVRLAEHLKEKLVNDKDINFDTFESENFRLKRRNGKPVKQILARITGYIEAKSGENCRYEEYMNTETESPYEIEHIWGEKHYHRMQTDFEHEQDFLDYRNKIGGLLLLPKKFNGSYGGLPYENDDKGESKLHYYSRENLLAKSLNQIAYKRNPGFNKFIEESGLVFKPHPEFRKADLDERGELYREIAKRIWNPDNLLKIIE